MAEEFRQVVELALLCDPSAPRLAREALERIEGIDEIRADARVVVSELVSNSVRHSGCTSSDRIQLFVRLGTHVLEIAVRDPGRSGQAPALARERPEIGGLGLPLVDQLATRWGADRAGSCLVWAELAVAPASGKPPAQSVPESTRGTERRVVR